MNERTVGPVDPAITSRFDQAVQDLEKGHLSDAISGFECVARQGLADPAVFNNLGNAYLLAGQFEHAIARYLSALFLNPTSPQMLTNLGVAFMSLRMLNAADQCFTRALQLDGAYPSARWNRGLLCLLRADYQAGWAGYEWRWRLPRIAKLQSPGMPPRWDGRPLQGESVLVYCEQGFGDTLQFVRFVPEITKRGGRPIVVCQPALASLLRGNAKFGLVCAAGSRVPRAEYSVPMMSLPYTFGVGSKIDTVTPYLQADPRKVEVWQARFSHLTGPKIGIVWAGNGRVEDPLAHAVDRRRSMRFSVFSPLVRNSGMVFVSLQQHDKDVPHALREYSNIVDIGGELQDFSETAAVIQALDLTLAVDTAIVHVCGALGRPVWMLSRYDGCWRWLLDSPDSPWYPSLRIFRQRIPGDWDEVISRVVQALRDKFGA